MWSVKESFCIILAVTCFVLTKFPGAQCSRASNRGRKCESFVSPEKRFVKSTIAVKALVTKHHNNKNRIAEIWILDVYKGEDKLAAGLGLPGTGAEAVFHLKDQ